MVSCHASKLFPAKRWSVGEAKFDRRHLKQMEDFSPVSNQEEYAR